MEACRRRRLPRRGHADAHLTGTRGLRVLALKLSGVRNLEPLVLEPGPRFNVFSGDNGQGKTNLLETIYVVGALRSFRTQRLAELIQFGADAAYVGARISRGGIERVYELTQAVRSRKVRLDGKTIRPISKYFGEFNVVLFAPEDLQVPRGSPGERRRFIDRAVFNRRPDYLPGVQAYEKVVKNRNALLRDLADGRQPGRRGGDLLAVYDAQLAEIGARIVAARRQLLGEIQPLLSAAFESITRTGLPVEVVYSDSAELAGVADAGLAEALLAALQKSGARDRARQTTSVGPHRDDLEFRLAGRPAGAFASQGQLRALVLAWKTAEMDLLAATHGEPPVLLLDDVSSELDPTRNEYLFQFLRSRPSQCFITTTHRRHVLLTEDRVDYAVEAGRITREIAS